MKGEGETGDGSHDRWCAIIEELYGQLLKLALRLTRGNQEQAEDIAHDAICKVLTGEHPLLAEVAAPAYMATTLKRVFFDGKKQFYIEVQNKDDAGGGGEPSENEKEAVRPDRKDGGKERKSYRSRFLSYDDEQNETLREGLGDAEAVGKIQSTPEEEFNRLFRKTAGRLTKRERDLFELHYVERMTPVEIAEKLGGKPDLVAYDIKALKAKVRGRVISYGRSLARRKK